MKKAISTEQTASNIAKVVGLLAEMPDRFERLSKPLTDDQIRQPLGAGERSIVETLAHVIHCEALTADSIYLALMLNEPLILPIHAERDLGKLLRFDLLPFADLLAYFRVRRAVLLRVLNALDEKGWARTVREEGKQRREAVYWRARGHALHEAEHVSDLEAKLSNLGESG